MYRHAKAFTHLAEQQLRLAKLALEWFLWAWCRPYLDDPTSAQARLFRRAESHIKEIFVFVVYPEVPPENPLEADRRAQLRSLAISPKISGGIRS